MNSKTKTVGGSPQTALGQDFNQFLSGGLQTGNFGNNAAAQTSGMGGAINQLLQGHIGDPSSLQGYLQGLQGSTGGAGNLPNVSGNYNPSQYQGMDFSSLGQVGTQGPQIQMGGQNAGLNMQGIGGAGNLPGIQFNPSQFQNTRIQGSAVNQGLGQFLQPQTAQGLDYGGAQSQALQQIAQQGLDKSVADTRERYTGQSGTPAGFAEAALRAQLQPQLINALSQANQTQQGLNLQQQGLNQSNTQAILGLSGQATNNQNQLAMQQGLAGNQFNQANTQLGLNAQGINTQNILQNQGLQNQGMLGLNSNLLSQLGLGNDATNAFNQANLQSFGQQQQGQQMNQQNLLQQMQQMLGQNQNMNAFNQQNSQFGSTFGQQAQQMNAGNQLQNQGLMNQYGLGVGGLGMQNQQQQLQAILGALGPLFGGLQQGTALGTPQAQTVQKPSFFSQLTGGIANIGQGLAPFLTGGLGNLSPSVPNFIPPALPSNFPQFNTNQWLQ